MPRRLSLVISSLGAGGAERVISIMASWWAERGDEITLITLSGGEKDFYPLSPKVHRVSLDVMGASTGLLDAILANVRRLRALRQAIARSRPEAVISFMEKTNILVLLATRGLDVPVIISERVDPRHHPIGRAWNALRRHWYRFASALVMQTEALREWGEQHVRRERVFVIPNPVLIECPSPREASPGGGNGLRRILAMGRLTSQKGFDVLLRAFAQVAREAPDWSLTILGEGELRSELRRLAEQLRIDGRVEMPGRVTNPESHFAESDLFVLPSRYEGFPNALLEAMACGLPVVSTDCPTGPAEMITPDLDGVLVPVEDPEQLAQALLKLIRQPELRKQLGEKAREVRARYGVEAIMALWDKAIAQVTRRGR